MLFSDFPIETINKFGYRMVPPSYNLVYNPPLTIVISAINQSLMGVMFTNLANELGHHLVPPMTFQKPPHISIEFSTAVHTQAGPPGARPMLWRNAIVEIHQGLVMLRETRSETTRAA